MSARFRLGSERVDRVEHMNGEVMNTMADMEKKRVVGSHPTGMTSTGALPTGADVDSDGSSVETDSDVASSDNLYSTEEILRMAEEKRKSKHMRKH
jgi:hypothetical protein